MTKKELLDKYTERKNNYYLSYNKLSDSTKEYVSTAHLLMADVFSDLIEDIKSLPNEPKRVRNNEQKEKKCHSSSCIFIYEDNTVICKQCIYNH